MTEIFKNYSLKNHNTFRIEAYADYFSVPETMDKLFDLLKNPKYKNKKKIVFGKGSNLLISKNLNALVIKPALKGIHIVEDDENVVVKVAAGVIWDDFVQWAVDKGYYGVENLSLIPGTVGAAPVQNIGAYGVELKDVLLKLDAVHIETLNLKTFTNKACEFAYRNSIFKGKLKGEYIITHVYFKLSKTKTLKLDYGKLESELKKIGHYDLQAVRQAVINIRSSKLPDPDKLPNAGSFFKNPVIQLDKFKDLQKKFAKLVHYPAEENKVKLAAGQLIDLCGLKGYRSGSVGVHENQALVLVNYGNAGGKEILNLARFVQKKVHNTFGIMLEFEVNVL